MKLYLTTILFLTLILSSCTSYTPEKVNARYLKLSKNLDYLMDDEINEKKRASLEKDFSNFFQGMKDYKEKNKDLDTRYLNYLGLLLRCSTSLSRGSSNIGPFA